MPWHLSMYSLAVAAVTDSDITAPIDGILGIRNGHLLLTEDFKLIAACGNGSLLSRLRFGNAQLTQKVQPHIWPLMVSATVTNLPPVMDLRDQPIIMPVNEEITVLGTTTGAGPSDVQLMLLLASPDWNRNIPAGDGPWIIRGTVTITAGAESAWTNPAAITWERDPLNGVYAVIGAEVVAANATQFRIQFVDMKASRGKQYRPGGLVMDTAALQPWEPQRGGQNGLGEWGRFHTFTPPLIQTFDDTAGGTYEVRMLVKYLGQDRNLVFQGPG